MPGNLLLESGIWENFSCGIQNPESWAMKTGIQLKESGIPLTIGVPPTKTGIQCLESGIRGVESRIHTLENTFLTFSLYFKGVV